MLHVTFVSVLHDKAGSRLQKSMYTHTLTLLLMGGAQPAAEIPGGIDQRRPEGEKAEKIACLLKRQMHKEKSYRMSCRGRSSYIERVADTNRQRER